MVVARTSLLALILVFGLAGLSLSACDRQGPAERAGERIDDTVDEATDRIEDTTDEISDRLDGDR